MGVFKGIFLVLVLLAVSLRGEDEVMEDEEVIGENEKNDEHEMDWGQMFQMGMALGKSILGEEAVEKIKKGDLSELIKVGEKVLGEDMVKDFLNSATQGDGEKEGNNTSTGGDTKGEDDGDGDSLDDIEEEAKPNTAKVTDDEIIKKDTNEGNDNQEV